jgi:hypothetical protein
MAASMPVLAPASPTSLRSAIEPRFPEGAGFAGAEVT